MSKPSAITSGAVCPARPASRPAEYATTRKKHSRARAPSSAPSNFSLRDIRELLVLGDHACADTRTLAEHRLADIETRLLDLARMRRALMQLIRRCQAGDETGCPIVRTLGDGRDS